MTVDEDFTKKVIFIGLFELKNGHSALETKQAIESIVNEYSFDKRKVTGLFFFFALQSISINVYIFKLIVYSRHIV